MHNSDYFLEMAHSIYYNNARRTLQVVFIEALQRRAISIESADHFELGLAPKSHILSEFIAAIEDEREKSAYIKQGLELGLIVEQQGQISDRFINRMMIPLRDHQGRLVGFSGWSLDENTPASRYLNTQNSLNFESSNFLYAEHLLMNCIDGNQAPVVIVEGIFDAILLHQMGVKLPIALLGARVSEAQIQRIISTNRPIVLALDDDGPGRALTHQLKTRFEEYGIEVDDLCLEGEKDPADFVQKHKS